MSWPKSGTVAIANGSTTVTGTGTSWLSGVRVGDTLHAPDGRAYEITVINSATSITIAPAYMGSTVSGSAYSISPTRAYELDLASRVLSLITSFEDVKNNAGASKMADFIRYLSDQDTGWQRVASNTQAAICGGVEALRLTATGASGGAVQSSATDATAGKLVTVGAWGLGAQGSPEISDINSVSTPAGFYGFTSSTLNNASLPAGLSASFGQIIVSRHSSSLLSQIAFRNNFSGGLWQRVYSGGAWLSWVQISTEVGIQSDATDATAGAVMTAGAFGIGVAGGGVPVGDLNDHTTPSGFYLFSVSTGSYGSRPSGYTYGDFGCVRIERYNADFLTQTIWRAAISGPPKPFQRRYANGTWTEWSPVYGGENIVGTVSQSGGVPTGGIIERSSNANGEYTRWADGTQICEGVVNTSGTAAVSRTWPAAFSGVPRVALSSALTTAAMATVASTSATSANFYMWNHDGTQRSGYVGFIAKGTWF